jgi:transcriptional regulator with XRE-family HTH domain
MGSIKIEQLAQHIQEHRVGKGIRDAAKEAGVSAATLSRVENGKVPDLETFSKICSWLKVNPSIYLGSLTDASTLAPRARVHFKKGSAIKKDSAKALGEMILKAQQIMLEDELES